MDISDFDIRAEVRELDVNHNFCESEPPLPFTNPNPTSPTLDPSNEIVIQNLHHDDLIQEPSFQKAVSSLLQEQIPSPPPKVASPTLAELFAKEIEIYKRDGVVVIKNVLSPTDLKTCRDGFHEDLLRLGVDYSNLQSRSTTDALKKLQTHQSGGLPFYYSAWQLQHCHTNQRYFDATRAIWESTWASGAQHFENPFSGFDVSSGFTFLDSFGVNFRLPSEVGKYVQKTIGLHVDLNPWQKWSSGRRVNKRWRPMQGFIALTDNTGGFECCPGFHKRFDQYFEKIPQPEGHTQGYYGLQDGKTHSDLHKQIKPVQYEAGDAVIWDWRLPHQIAPTHPGPDTREVVYASFLPNIPLNKKYILEQKTALLAGQYPPDVYHWWEKGIVPAWKKENVNLLNPLGRELLGIDS